jgi:hypothetical protein
MGELEREMARAFVEAFNDGDSERIAEMTHPDGELRGLRYEVDGTSYRGREGVNQFWADATELWDELRIGDPEFFDRDGRTLIICRLILRGRGSGAVVEHAMAMRADLRDGLAILMHTSLDVERARREFDEA